MEFPKVFIIILNHNGGKIIRNCLESLAKVDYPNIFLVVVDNGSTDDSFVMIKNIFPNVHAIRNEKNLGFAAGNNVGIRYALEHCADYVLLLNQDTQVEPDFLKKLIVVAKSDSRIGILSPLIFWKRTSEVWFSGGRINWLTMKSIHERKLRSGNSYTTEFVTGCSMLIRKAVFEKIGLLSEKYFLYWEDADFSCKAEKGGFLKKVVPESRIYHFEAYSEPTSKKLYWLVYSGLIFFERNASFLVKLWINFYYQIRKVKNRFDLTFRDSENARVVRKAYYEFDHGKI